MKKYPNDFYDIHKVVCNIAKNKDDINVETLEIVAKALTLIMGFEVSISLHFLEDTRYFYFCISHQLRSQVALTFTSNYFELGKRPTVQNIVSLIKQAQKQLRKCLEFYMYGRLTIRENYGKPNKTN